MKPAQKIVLSCRQTSEAAGRLMDWLDLNHQMFGVGRAAIREDIDALAARLIPLARASEAAPTIGLIATPGSEKTELLFALLATRTPTLLGQLGQRPLDAATIRGLLPEDTNSGGCVILRFCAGEMPPTPRGYPVHISLLSIIDIAAVITRAALTARVDRDRPSAQEIAVLFDSISTQLSPQAVPGLSERDVVDLRETLNAIIPDHPLLPALAAGRYWEQFREIAAHIPERDRRRVFGVLWRDDPWFTLLFNRLCDGLERLGQGADAYCPPEALLGKDKTTGWMTRHPRSIIQAATLKALDQFAGPTLGVMNRYGQAVEVERAVLAALIEELPLHIATSRLNDFAPAELLDFPIPLPLSSEAPQASATSPSTDFANAVQHFARAKAIHLFERACLRRTVTALVVVADPHQEDDTFSAAIGDWVETAQGATAQARGRIRRGLFIAAALHRSRNARSRDSDAVAKMQFLIREVLGQDQTWPTTWTPDRPLTEVHWFSAAQTESVVAPFPQAHGQALAAIAPAATGPDTSLSGLIQSLELACDARVKYLQLNQGLQEIRRRLRGTVLRHHASNDPAALADWRRGTAVIIQDRLLALIEHNRLGHLQRALLPQEDELTTAIEAAMVGPGSTRLSASLPTAWTRNLSEPEPRLPFSASEDGPTNASVMADAAIAYWLKEMRRGSRAMRLCRDLRIEPAIYQHLVDELQIGTIRLSLSTDIANAYVKSAVPQTSVSPLGGPSPPRSLPPLNGNGAGRLAAYACRIINAYLEVLGGAGLRSRSGPNRHSRTHSSDLEVADTAMAGYASGAARSRTGARRSTRPSQEQWEISFLNLVEENIAAAHLLVGRGDKDRELGELIQLFAPGPYEVET